MRFKKTTSLREVGGFWEAFTSLLLAEESCSPTAEQLVVMCKKDQCLYNARIHAGQWVYVFTAHRKTFVWSEASLAGTTA